MNKLITALVLSTSLSVSILTANVAQASPLGCLAHYMLSTFHLKNSMNGVPHMIYKMNGKILEKRPIHWRYGLSWHVGMGNH